MAGNIETIAATRFVPIVAGGSYQVPDRISLVIIDNAATIGAFSPLVINLPLNPDNSQVVRFTATAMVSGVTLSANAPRIVVGALNTIGSSVGNNSVFFAGGLNTWYGVP